MYSEEGSTRGVKGGTGRPRRIKGPSIRRAGYDSSPLRRHALDLTLRSELPPQLNVRARPGDEQPETR
jgi:hypothetical protein